MKQTAADDVRGDESACDIESTRADGTPQGARTTENNSVTGCQLTN
jgi:hypothetical protein